jgi:hypothetical protein
MIKAIGIGLAIIVGIVVLSWGLMASNIVSFGIQREAIQQSQPYVETKISLLHKLHTDWLQLDAEITEARVAGQEAVVSSKIGQQKEIVNRMRYEAGLIAQSQIPDSIKYFLRSH